MRGWSGSKPRRTARAPGEGSGWGVRGRVRVRVRVRVMVRVRVACAPGEDWGVRVRAKGGVVGVRVEDLC